MSAISGTLADLIEHERGELMQIHAMTRCLKDVLLHADDDDAPLHADVAQVIARLLHECAARLEAVRVHVAQLEATANAEVVPANQVRERRAHYVVDYTRVGARRSECPQLEDGDSASPPASEPWPMVRDCVSVARTGDYLCKPSSRSWVS